MKAKEYHTTASGTAGISFFGAMFLVLFTLKITGVIDWSWWWVTAPLWGSFLLGAGIAAVVFGLYYWKATRRGN